MKKERVEEIVNNEEIELLYPEDPDQYYVYKIRPIWARKSDLDIPVSNLSINDPKKMKKYDIDEFNYMEFIPEPKNIQQENNDKIEILHPNEPVKYYKSKMVPIWKREAEPAKNNDEIVEEPNDRYYYQNKIRPIWNQENELSISEAIL